MHKIPPTRYTNAHNNPELPLVELFSCNAFPTPTAQDCNAINKNKTMEMIPIVNLPLLHTPFLLLSIFSFIPFHDMLTFYRKVQAIFNFLFLLPVYLSVNFATPVLYSFI